MYLFRGLGEDKGGVTPSSKGQMPGWKTIGRVRVFSNIGVRYMYRYLGT